MLLDQNNGFKKHGGYCTEFTDKNMFYINMLKASTQRSSNNNSHEKEKNNPHNKTLNTFRKNKFSTLPNSNYNTIKTENSPSPVLDKAKEVIEQKNLFKLKYFLVKSGAIKNKK